MMTTGLYRDINRWDEYLPFVTYIYNTSSHTTTNETPHYLLYGQDPIEPDDISSDTAKKRCIDEGFDEFYSIWKNAIEMAHDPFKKVQNSQKKFTDKDKQEKNLNYFYFLLLLYFNYFSGDKVLLLDYCLRSKLSPRLDGPYIVTRKIGFI